MIRSLLSLAILVFSVQVFAADFVGTWATSCSSNQNPGEFTISKIIANADKTGNLSTDYFNDSACANRVEQFSTPMTFDFDMHTVTVTFSPDVGVKVVMTASYVLVGDMLTLVPKQTWINGQEQQVTNQNPVLYTRQ